jgi:putative transposase
MKRKRFTVEQITRMLREAEVHLSQGKSVKLVSRELGITEQTYYSWRKEYGGMKASQARRLKELELENTRLKRAVADLLWTSSFCERRWREITEPRAASKMCFSPA